MKYWNLPPEIKIYEALSAIADDRVQKVGDNHYSVLSSARSKSYDVHLGPGAKQVTSNDNGSYWRGYLGYPAVAVLMLEGRLPFDMDIATLISDIEWKDLNDSLRNDYYAAIRHVLDGVRSSHGSAAASAAEALVDDVIRLLSANSYQQTTGKRIPPP